MQILVKYIYSLDMFIFIIYLYISSICLMCLLLTVYIVEAEQENAHSYRTLSLFDDIPSAAHVARE